jgi:hypothetical protein
MEAIMRRFIQHALSFAAVILISSARLTPVFGQIAPGYWAGDLSLAPTAADNLNQPASAAAPVALPVIPQAPVNAENAIPNQTRQALGFYGGRSALATLNEVPHSAVYQSTQAAMPQAARRPAKPFQNAANRPALSPYLNLFRDEKNSTGIPNYYAFVQPQMEQEAAGQRQQIQSQRRERQGQAAASDPGAVGPGVAPTAAHFMDTAQFYSAWRR